MQNGQGAWRGISLTTALVPVTQQLHVRKFREWKVLASSQLGDARLAVTTF